MLPMAATKQRPEAELGEALSDAWSAETSFDPGQWNEQNPAWGQCAVTALIVQETMGGELVRGWVEGIEHYWNKLPDGRELDLTWQQFPTGTQRPIPEVVARAFVLSFPATRGRYRLLHESLRRKPA